MSILFEGVSFLEIVVLPFSRFPVFPFLKDFKDWDISDFKDMGSLAHHPIQKDRISFNGFVKAIKGQPYPQYKDYPTSRLAGVL